MCVLVRPSSVTALRFAAAHVITMGFGTMMPTTDVGYIAAYFSMFVGGDGALMHAARCSCCCCLNPSAAPGDHPPALGSFQLLKVKYDTLVTASAVEASWRGPKT